MNVSEVMAQHYGTKVASAAPAEDRQLAAQIELFYKIAEEQGVTREKLAELPDDKLNGLWSEFQGDLLKMAAEHEFGKKKEEGGDDEKLKEKAEKEHEEKKAELLAVKEADLHGRISAHAMVDELSKIAAESPEVNQEAAAAVAALYGKKEAASIIPSGETLHKLRNAVHMPSGGTLHSIREAVKHPLPSPQTMHSARKFVNEHPKTVGGAAAGTVIAGGAAAGHHMDKKEHEKEASAIDMLAAQVAVQKIAQHAFGVAKADNQTDEVAQQYAEQEAKTAADRIAACDTLGAYSQESVKVAQAGNLETAIDWRACELLETAGYPITWPA